MKRFGMLFAVLLSLACWSFGQGTFTLTTPTGTITQPLMPGGGQSLDVRVRNGSGSDQWGLAAQPAGVPIAFYDWVIEAPPGYTLLMGGLFGARQLGPSTFQIASPDDWKLPARRNGVDLWPATAGYHRILPGDTLYARVVPAADPWETAYLASVLTPERRAAALDVMAFDEARIAKWPWLAKVVNSYTFNAACMNPATPPGQRGPGWLLVPGNFADRWTDGAAAVGQWVQTTNTFLTNVPIKSGHALKTNQWITLSSVQEWNGTKWNLSPLNGSRALVTGVTSNSCTIGVSLGSRVVTGGILTRDAVYRLNEGLAHWYGLGSRSAVAGENLSNEHYRAAADWLGVGIRNNDVGAITVGLYLLRAKCAYGLVDCDPPHIDKGKWRNEKGDLARGTTGTRPDRAKEYDRDLAVAHAAGFTSEEPLLGRAAGIRMGSLLGPTWSWSGSGGARMLGHYLENLRDWYVATDDDRFRARAQLEIDHAMTVIVKAKPYFVDDPAHEKVSGGEGLCALAACRWWALHGAGASWQSKLDTMLAWYELRLYSGGNTAYYAVVNADGSVTWQANAEFGSLNWLQIPGLSPAVRNGIETHCFTKYANRADVDAAFGGEGPGWEKFWPWIVGWGATSE